MPGLVPGIHDLRRRPHQDVDGRDQPGHDERGEQPVDVKEIRKIEAYLRRLFGNARIRVVPRPKKDDSVEVYIDQEFVAVISADEDEGDYNFNMSILAMDLE
jgi:hypothetical protein